MGRCRCGNRNGSEPMCWRDFPVDLFLEEEFKLIAPDKNEAGNKTYSQRLRQRLLGAYEQYFLIRCQHDLQLSVDEICR